MINTYESPFLISSRQNRPPSGLLKKPLEKTIELISGLRRCQQLYEHLDTELPAEQFPSAALNSLSVDYQVAPHAQSRIPQTGPCILIANHPFGGIEGLILIDLLSKIRPDVKVMANYLLARIPELRDRLIEVDPFGGENAARTNLTPLRQALNWLKQGGLLVMFPAGEVSSYQPGQGVCDPPWSSTLSRLVKKSKSPVLPVFFLGDNGPLFQLAGRIHSSLRTLLLPRMMLNKAGKIIELRIGNLLSTKKLSNFDCPRKLNDYLRLRTYALELSQKTEESGSAVQSTQRPLLGAQPIERLEMEISILPPEHRLLQSGEFDVITCNTSQAPVLMQEIGRLRELTFRAVGEGTGKSLDLDRFDEDYTHLCLWHREKRELVGAYRVGQVDKLLKSKGSAGLYTTTLFDFKPQLLERLDNALELGRSFIRPEYQRSYAPLLLLWKGIGHFLVANPQYRYLFGPVSISSDYSSNSRQLMASALTRNYLIDELAKLVQPRLPVSLSPLPIKGFPAAETAPLLQDMEEISTLVADLETDGKGIPVLLRHYLSLGGKLLAFNLDPDFGNVIDGLLLVDLQQTDRKQLQRYMGREGYTDYFAKQSLSACA